MQIQCVVLFFDINIHNTIISQIYSEVRACDQ